MVFWAELRILAGGLHEIQAFMMQLSFWHKVAFIANICWLFSLSLRYYNAIPTGHVQSSILITGLVIATALNVVVNLWTGFLFIRNKRPAIPRWLMLANFIFLIPQLYLFFS